MLNQKKSAVIAATFTAEPVYEDLAFLLAKVGFDLELIFCPYNQVFQELLSEASSFATNANGINVALIRLEDFLREIVDTKDFPNTIATTVEELSNALSNYCARAKVQTIVAIFSPSPNSPDLTVALETATSQLISHARSLPGLTVLTSADIDAASDGDKYDTVSDELAHIPFAQPYFAAMALAISRKAHALLKPPFKVLVLDCDNTLWRGVVGEDGVDGIAISSAFAALQRFAIKVHSQGTLICLVSKNTEADVLEVFEKRNDMVLSLDQIVAHRINWELKSQNIASLAQSLNLGLDSFVFIDDNPMECAQVQRELPQVLTLQLPPENKIEPFLANLWAFDKASVTDEDKRRTQMYKENAARKQLETTTTDIRDFITSLNVVTEISAPAEGDWPRLAQLTQRTNQFNFTTLRQTEAELRTRARDGRIVLRVNVKDRFGDYGLVGLVVAHNHAKNCVVDIFLLSCRVLGRGVEHSILRHLGMHATKLQLENVDLACLSTPKNEPARAFIESVAAKFRLDLDGSALYRIPSSEASVITHRPGEDPDAVVAASKSTETSDRKLSGPSATAAPSERYLALAQTLTTGSAIRLAVSSASARKRTLPEGPSLASTATEQKLLTLWEQMIGIEGLGIDDDYFAIGGNSLLAARLFAEITRQFQIKLPLTTILDSPTIRTLSRRIDQREFPTSSLINLKPGSNRNLFLVHDGDGETLLYANLAQRLPNDVAVFGIEPKTLPNIPLAYSRIEDIAARYIELMREIQPQGPYLVGGMCAGGVIAYEMSCQLRRAGEEVGLLLLIDAATPGATKRPGRITKNRLGRLTGAIKEPSKTTNFQVISNGIMVILKKTWNAISWEAQNLALRCSARARFLLLQTILHRGWKWPSIIPSLTFREIYESAEGNYNPKPLTGPNIVLVRATFGEMADTPYLEVYSDASLGWATLVSNLTIADVEGGHSSMLQEPFVESLADAIRPVLNLQSKQKPIVALAVTESA